MSAIDKKFTEKYATAVIAACKGTGIFPSVTMSQMIIESDRGRSWLARNANNFFGIKIGKGWAGKKVRRTDKADNYGAGSNDYYRVYNSPLESILDHSKFLKLNPRYIANGVFTAKTPTEQAKALQKAGYAASSGYSKLLISIIKTNNLERLDAGINTPLPAKNNNNTIYLIIGGLFIAGTAAYFILNNGSNSNNSGY